MHRTEREALEAIARRKKRERRLEKERQRAVAEHRRIEQEYLKGLLSKSLKKPKPCGGPHVTRTRSQKRRAVYRKYLEKEKLTPEEEVQVSHRKKYLSHRVLMKKAQKVIVQASEEIPVWQDAAKVSDHPGGE